jgi:predicted small secreted protein
MKKALIVIVLVLGALVMGGIGTYNGLVGKQQGVDAALR